MSQILPETYLNQIFKDLTGCPAFYLAILAPENGSGIRVAELDLELTALDLAWVLSKRPGHQGLTFPGMG